MVTIVLFAACESESGARTEVWDGTAEVVLPDDGPWDRDGDGYESDVDCDDGNVAVHPDAAELCDDADQDCDGNGWEPGACVGEQDASAMGVKLTGTIFGYPTVVRDVTGDGAADIMDGNYQAPLSIYGYGYWTGTTISSEPGNFPEDATQATFFEHDGEAASMARDFGDVDGDGANDAGLVGNDGGIFIALGPIPNDGGFTNVFDTQWVGAVSDGLWGDDVATGDFNGDGLGDAAVTVYDAWMDECDECSNGIGGVWLYWGGTFGTEHTQIGDWNSGYLWEVGDITGDGVDDLVVDDPDGNRGVRGSTAWVDGGDLAEAPAAGAWMTDLAYANWSDQSGEGYGWFPIGDLDNDGTTEILTNFLPDASQGSRELLVYSGDQRGEIGAGDALGGWTLTGKTAEATYTWAARCGGNLLLNNQTYLLVLPPPTGIPPIESSLSSQRVTLTHPERAFPTFDCGDVTGDGSDDLVYGMPEGNTDHSQIRIIPGWSIPWDDPTYW